MTAQLAFDLPTLPAFRPEDFFTTQANAPALSAISDPGQNRLILIGPQGAGKTHLAHVWLQKWSAGNPAILIQPHELAHHLPNLARNAAVAVDNADAAERDETAFFHLYNLLVPSGRLLLTATTPPRDWGLTLPDLASRLTTMPQARLDPPDDALLSAVLVKLFADRQTIVSPNLIAYLVTRMDRSIAAARSLVAQLDALALARGGPITRVLAAELMDITIQG
jgi:chromosomal replication initiation ATPase DnaA